MSLKRVTLKIEWYDAEMKFEVDKDDTVLSLPVVHTYGLCIEDNDMFIALAAEELPNSYRGVTLIPKSLIVGKPMMLVEDN